MISGAARQGQAAGGDEPDHVGNPVPVGAQRQQVVGRGGPDVKWVSTQHNLIATIFLMNLAQRLDELGDSEAAAAYREAAAGLMNGIDSQLLVRDKESAHFRQGVGDDVVPLDTQAIGTIYAFYRGDGELAKQLYEFALKNFSIGGRSIKESKAKATYNMTYAAKGPFAA